MEVEKKGSEQNIIEEPQEYVHQTLNVLLIGTSGIGKSSLINYLAGATLAKVSKSGISCTTETMFYDVTLFNKKLRIFDTQGFNDTATSFTEGTGMWPQRLSSRDQLVFH